jgi:putative MATE family efflux protein
VKEAPGERSDAAAEPAATPAARSTDRRIIALAVPALGSLAVEPLYVLVDTAVVGRLGTAQLGGLALSATVLTIVVAGCNFLTYGTTERVARRLGGGRAGDAADVGVQAAWLSIAVGLTLAPVIGLAAPWLARGLGGDGDVLDFAVTYLRISAVGVPFVVFAMGAQGVQRGAADYKRPLVILFSANVVNTVLELIFVFGLDWGVPGSAWSTVIAQVLAAAAFVVALRRHLAPARHRRPSRAGMAPLMTAGKYLILRVGSMMVVMTGATAIAARVDEPTLAAHQIAASMFGFLALMLDSLAIPAQTLVADELGQGNRDGAADVARRSAGLSARAGVALAVPLAVLAPILPHAFTADPAVQSRATSALLLLAVVLLPGAVAFAYDGSLIGAGDYRFLGLAAFAYLALAVPLGAIVLAFNGAHPLGIAGIWGSLALWMGLRAVVNRWRAEQLLGSLDGQLAVAG